MLFVPDITVSDDKITVMLGNIFSLPNIQRSKSKYREISSMPFVRFNAKMSGTKSMCPTWLPLSLYHEKKRCGKNYTRYYFMIYLPASSGIM